jgi:hypothetical protein
MTSDGAAFRAAVRRLHREKDAAYRDSWKRRGELMSIAANIARKVDRLDQAARGARASSDENLLDTAVDLLVYSLKYQTYLADIDAGLANDLLAGATTSPHSDGTAAFEVLLDRVDLDAAGATDLTDATEAVVGAFDALERRLAEHPLPAPRTRLGHVLTLTDNAANMIAVLRRDEPQMCQTFADRWGGDDAR